MTDNEDSATNASVVEEKEALIEDVGYKEESCHEEVECREEDVEEDANQEDQVTLFFVQYCNRNI